MSDAPGAQAGGRRAAGAARSRPKGRALDEAALAEVRSLLGDRPRRRDLLIEHLHLINDAFGSISAAHLKALAEEMRLAEAEVYEVATFYHHFTVLREGEAAPPKLIIRVCDGLPCAMAGAEALLARLGALYAGGAEARVLRAPCVGRCDAAPVAEVGANFIDHAQLGAVQAAVEAGATAPILPSYETLEAYEEAGGYQSLAALRDGARGAEALIEDLLASGLRGMGGAGFPAGRKWAAVRAAPGPRLMAVNADEGEPGTFKDRYYLEREPHQVLEGTLIAAWAVAAERVYVYLRDEYPAAREILSREIAALEAQGLIEPGFLELRRGAGAYICGEESAMIESIEGKRGLPRHRPPYVAERGLFGRPTLVHNVETLYWIKKIAEAGPTIFNQHGQAGRTGVRSVSVSGRVRYPGVKLAPAGITARELIEEYCGGMEDGHVFKAYLPGGASGGVLPARLADIPLDFDTIQPHGGFIGSAAVIVLSHRDDVRDAALNLMRFFKHESCGQCTPCRVGCAKAAEMMTAPRWDRETLNELCAVMEDASICGLGQAAPNPIRAVLTHWPEEAGLEAAGFEEAAPDAAPAAGPETENAP
ncbi:MAG: NADH-ubiquinone oxidoreductase-F iron-sulfur binding region domain-containing protein [Pseudomonadota bacterium]